MIKKSSSRLDVNKYSIAHIVQQGPNKVLHSSKVTFPTLSAHMGICYYISLLLPQTVEPAYCLLWGKSDAFV